MKKKLLTSLILFILSGVFYYTLPFFLSLELNSIPESYIIYDVNDKKIGEIIKDNKYRHQETDINQIPTFIKESIILMEDKTFYENGGIDYKAIVRATIANFEKGEVIEGASTISSQLIRNSQGVNEKRTMKKKLEEFMLARTLNKKYSKNEILEKYCNILYFGYMNYGFASASEYYFGKELHNLTKAEMIALLAIPKNASLYNPISQKENFQNRFDFLVDYLHKNNLLTEKEYILAKNEKLIFNIENEYELGFIKDFVKLKYISDSEKTGYSDIRSISIENTKIITNIDYDLTETIQKLGNASLKDLEDQNVTDYGIILIERKTNNLKVMIGGYNYDDKKHGQVNSTISLRQVGSTIKPFTYLLGFQNLNLQPGDKILDMPIQYETAEGYTYEPQNYSLDYKGEVTIAESLSQSLNIPAIKMTQQVGSKTLYDFLELLGISSLEKHSEDYGLALTLGAGEISLYELTRAYSIFANQGEFCDINILSNEKRYCQKVTEKKYTDMIELILTNRYFKLNSFPINSNLDFEDRYVFVKTGTSRNFRDNFAVGFTKNYVIGVWVGNKDASYMQGVSGVSGAGNIFRKIVYELEDEKIDNKIVKLEDKQLNYVTITHPLNGSTYLLEDFRPNDSQLVKLEFGTNMKFDYKKWYINGQETKEQFVSLEKGIYEIKVEVFSEGKKIGEDISHIKVVTEE